MHPTITRLAIAIAVAFVVACSPPASPPATEPASPQTAAITATPSTSAQLLVGRWGDNGDCAKDIVFAEDGTFRSYTGGSGAWALDGNTVTMSGSGGTFQVQIEIIGDNQLLIQNPDGSVGTSQRC